jgi:hypothetical protein
MAGIEEVETVKTLPMHMLGNTKRRKEVQRHLQRYR